MTPEHPSNTLRSATGTLNSGFEINVDRFRALAQANAEWTEKCRLAGDGTPLGSTGAMVIRNSWGSAWGDEGYAYLPYGYVVSQMAVDFWTLYGLKWLDDLKFGAEAHKPERVAAESRPD